MAFAIDSNYVGREDELMMDDTIRPMKIAAFKNDDLSSHTCSVSMDTI